MVSPVICDLMLEVPFLQTVACWESWVPLVGSLCCDLLGHGYVP